MYVLKELTEWDGVSCSVKLYTREDTAVEAFKEAVLEDIRQHNWNNDEAIMESVAKNLYNELLESEDGHCEEPWNREIYFTCGPRRSYQFCDYNDNYNTEIDLIQLTPID